MNSTLLTIVIVLVFAVLILHGCRKGFAESLLSILSLIVSILLVSAVTPHVKNALYEYTSIDSGIRAQCEKQIGLSVEKPVQENADKGVGSSAEMESQERMKNRTFTDQEQDSLIERLNLPVFLRAMLKENNRTEKYRTLAVETFNEYVPAFVADLIMNVIAFLLSWVLVVLALWLAGKILRLLVSLPLIRTVDHLLGGVLGVAQALMIVWIFMLILVLFENTKPASMLLDMIRESRMLHKLYDTNILLNFLRNDLLLHL